MCVWNEFPILLLVFKVELEKYENFSLVVVGCEHFMMISAGAVRSNMSACGH